MSGSVDPSTADAVAEELRCLGGIVMPPALTARLNAVIADEVRDRLLHDCADEVPNPTLGSRNFANPPAHYDASGLGIHRPVTNGC